MPVSSTENFKRSDPRLIARNPHADHDPAILRELDRIADQIS